MKRRLSLSIWLLVVGVSACFNAPAPESPFAGEPAPTAPPRDTTTSSTPTLAAEAVRTVAGNEYFDGLRYDWWIPNRAGDQPLPIAILVHGDTPAGRDAMTPLAERLSKDGAAVMVVDVDTPILGARHPDPLLAVSCALATARSVADSHGANPDDVTLVGYDFGATVAMIIGQEPKLFLSGCDATAEPAVERIVGIAGTYDLDQDASADALRAYFGGERTELPGLWASGDPREYLGRRPNVPVLLIGGRLDTIVPGSVQLAWDQDLAEVGHPVELRWFAEAGHTSLVLESGQLAEVAEAIGEFLRRPASPAE